MYHFELANPKTGDKKIISVPEELTIAEFAREIRCEMGLQYTVGTRFHLIIDQDDRIFMQDDAIAEHVEMLWEGGDDPKDPEKKGPIYHEEFYHPESEYSLKDLFPKVGSNILYGQDYDSIYCTLKEITDDTAE